MWLCLNDAFFSLVSKDCARDEVLVRARRKGDIEKVFPGAVARCSEATDYLYRAAVKRDEVAAALAREVARITYPNFKDAVKDDDLHRAYLRVWAAMADLQPRRGWLDDLLRRDEPMEHAPKSRKYTGKVKRRRRRSLRRGR